MPEGLINDPTFSPRPGDLVGTSYVTRIVVRIEGDEVVYRHFNRRDSIPQRCTMREWRNWCVLKRAQPRKAQPMRA